MMFSRTLAVAPAVVAAISLGATPSFAADLSSAGADRVAVAHDAAWQPAAAPANDYRPWRGHRHRHRDGVSVGGVLAGALLIGGIAAVASAATRDSHRSDYPPPPSPPAYPAYHTPYAAPYPAPYPSPYPNQRADYAAAAARVCVDAVEHGARVSEGLTVDREDYGFTVRGRLVDGASFACSVDRDGRIARITYDGDDDRAEYAPPVPPREPYGMSEEQRAYRDSRLGENALEAAPAYPDVSSGDVDQPGGEVDTRPEYPGDLPQDRAGVQSPDRTPDAQQQSSDPDDGDLDPGRLGPGASSLESV